MRRVRLWGRVGCVLLALIALPNVARGPDVRRPATLEDLYGTTGNRFAGAIGFQTREANAAPEAISGYGVGIDDVVVEWREFTLAEDANDCDAVCVGGPDQGVPCSSDSDCGTPGLCGGGSCATISLSTNNVFQGKFLLEITVTDTTPSGNDCDHDGVVDTPRDLDCNNDLVPDVVVKVDSSQDHSGEYLLLNEIRRGVYRGTIPVSAAYDVPGTVFVATQGNLDPVVRATYVDSNDGTGRPCQNSVDPESWGLVQVSTTVFLTPGQLFVTATRLSDNGDDDGWADQGETVDLEVQVINRTGQRVTDVVLRLLSDDPDVACITRAEMQFGDLEPSEARFGAGTLQFLIAPTAARSDPFEELTATLDIAIGANEFDGLRVPQQIVLDLDLDASGGGPPTTYFESFESGFGSFTTMHLDEPLNPPESDLANRPAGVLNSDGYRCQYSDPDFTCHFGASCGAQCFPNPNGAFDRFFFDVSTDRAFSGARAMSFNEFLDEARGFTTPNSQLEAVRTIDPVNLGYGRVCSETRTVPCDGPGDCPSGESCEFAQPTLSLKHQVSFLDHRSVNAQPGRSADRGVLGVQLADLGGNPVGPWTKARPFVNVYDSQANSNYFNCTFDPVDDGNDEGDFFDPTDPQRRFGPSSTCAPELNFAHQGDTDAPFNPGELGDASDGPGLQGAHGIGTWVEPKVDLSRFRGRRVRVRLLTTGLKLGGAIHWEQAFNFNPDPGDDGWFVDDVTITDAVADPPAVVTADLKDNSGLATCADQTCGRAGGVDLDLALYPPSGVSAAPGQVVQFDASTSTVDVCLSGVLQYRFWVEVNGNATFEPTADVLLRDWTDNPRLSDVPRGATDYGIEARCATSPSCRATTVVPVVVDCPASGNVTTVTTSTPFLHRVPPNRRTLRLDGTLEGGGKTAALQWSTGTTLDAVRGDLRALRTTGFGGEICVENDYASQPKRLLDATPVEGHGDGQYFLLRSKAACNEPAAGGSYGGVGEVSTPARDTIVACPGN